MTGVSPGKRWSHLKIYLQRSGFEKTEIWNSDAMDPVPASWRTASALVGRVRGQFSLSYKATDLSPSGYYGYVALSNIRMTGCALPQIGQTCVGNTQSRFCCLNGNSISRDRLCDFSDDCGDNSDEIPRTCSDYKINCDFESGLCNWRTLIGGLSSWRLSTGYSTLTSGPTRDHTKGKVASSLNWNLLNLNTIIIQAFNLVGSYTCPLMCPVKLRLSYSDRHSHRSALVGCVSITQWKATIQTPDSCTLALRTSTLVSTRSRIEQSPLNFLRRYSVT